MNSGARARPPVGTRWLPFVFDIQPLETADLRDQALARLAAVPTYIDNEIANLREGLRLGYSAPRVTVEAVPGQVRSLIGPDSIFMGLRCAQR